MSSFLLQTSLSFLQEQEQGWGQAVAVVAAVAAAVRKAVAVRQAEGRTDAKARACLKLSAATARGTNWTNSQRR